MLRAPFIGREREQNLYQEFLKKASPWVLAITGLGGSGKSTLLSYLKEQTLSDRLVIKHNFASEARRIDFSTRKPFPIDPLTILETFADQVRFRCDLQAYSDFRDVIAKSRMQLAEQRTQIIQSVRVGNESRLEGGSFQISIDEIEETVHKIHYQVRELSASAFYMLIDTFTIDGLVVLLDTCEWLSEPVNWEVGSWVINEFILMLHERLVQKHKQCHIVFSSSVQLQLKSIPEQDVLELELSQLDEKAVEQHLKDIGIQNLELRQRIYEITYGNAACVSIISCLWQEQKEKPASPADFSEFRRRFNERAVKHFIDKHILDERLKPPLDDLTRYSILFRSFTIPMLKKVFGEHNDLKDSNFQSASYFKQFMNYLYIKRLGNYRYALLDLLREVLAESIRIQEPEKWEYYHQRALEYFQSDSQHLLIASYLSDCYYHSIACELTYDEGESVFYWQEKIDEAKIDNIKLEAILEAANDRTLISTSIAYAIRVYKAGHS